MFVQARATFDILNGELNEAAGALQKASTLAKESNGEVAELHPEKFIALKTPVQVAVEKVMSTLKDPDS
eukprot:12615013-Alexandrium_andersonii.AAC.1